MPSEVSVRRTFLRLLRSLRKLRNYLMRRRGPNMSLLTATFIDQDVRSDNLNWYDHSGYTEMTDPSLNINVTILRFDSSSFVTLMFKDGSVISV